MRPVASFQFVAALRGDSDSSHSSTYEELAWCDSLALGLGEGVQDGPRLPRKALLRDAVVAGSNELAYTDTRLSGPRIELQIASHTCAWAAAYDRTVILRSAALR